MLTNKMLPKKYPITCHTKHVMLNSTFVAIKGFNVDGNEYIKEAIKKGASKIVSDQENQTIINFCKKIKVKFELVKNARIYLAKECQKILKTNQTNIKIIGITGTKGKTTTTYIIDYIIRKAGFKTALLGTIKNKILDQEEPSFNTTPESDFLHMFLRQCNKKNIDYVIMEVSSHALSLYRTYGIKFDSIGFTNLAKEHLDFYKNMQKYFATKFKIFKQIKKNGYIVINNDNIWGKKALNKLKTQKNIISLEEKKIKLIDKYIPKNMPGKFNLYNFTMAFLICKSLGIPEKTIKSAIKNFTGIPGRLQKHILKNNATAFVDYAHNPSSMEEVLKTLSNLTKNLIVVFGCGGNRDKTKRPLMGKIAKKYGTKIIITNDNPRFENQDEIIKNITSELSKIDKKKFLVIKNRKRAIKYATQISNKNSIIAILGKGHEKYNLIKGKKYLFNDFEEIKKY